MRSIAHIGHQHVCPIHGSGSVVLPGQVHVRFNGIPLAVEGGACLCVGTSSPDAMVKGSTALRINGRGVMRVGDRTSHEGRIATGVPGLKSER